MVFLIDISCVASRLSLAQGLMDEFCDLTHWFPVCANTYSPLQVRPKQLNVNRSSEKWRSMVHPESSLLETVAELLKRLLLRCVGRKHELSAAECLISGWK